MDPTEEDTSPFSQAKLQRLLNVVHIEQTRNMIEFLASTGLRPGEMKALAWEDVDLEQGLAKQLGHSHWGMFRKTYGKWIANEKPDHRAELAKKLGQDDPNMNHKHLKKTS